MTPQTIDKLPAQKLPKQCPLQSIVATMLKLKLQRNIVTYTSLTYVGPTSNRAMPSGPSPARTTQKTCIYANIPLAAAEGNIVPVTITFEFPVTKAVFALSRVAARNSVKPVTVRGVGDTAWVIKPPPADRRLGNSGNSLFVLSGKTEIVVGAPPKATVAQLAALVRRIL